MAKTPLIITTERLVLRPLGMVDFDSIYEYSLDKENTKYMMKLPTQKHEIEEFLIATVADWESDNPLYYEFAVTLDNKHIGTISLYLSDDRQECDLGCIIVRNYQHKGYATEASKAVLDFAVTQLKVKKVIAYCDSRNLPSRKVIEKLGLSLERSDIMRRNGDSDEDTPGCMYSLII
jgi:Acetyltransferases, including N-acetylases of ribosomal proteins